MNQPEGDEIKIIANHIANAIGATFGVIPGYANSVGLNELDLGSGISNTDDIINQKKNHTL